MNLTQFTSLKEKKIKTCKGKKKIIELKKQTTLRKK